MILTPFQINVPQRKLDAIRAQLELAQIGYAPRDDDGWKYGTDARYLAEFRDYWLGGYDWRRSEAELNRFPQFMARVEDIDVHFYHVLGYQRFGAQGGDWGSGVTRALAHDHADVVAAIHLNLIFYINVVSDDPLLAAWRKTVAAVMARECAYLYEQQAKPQTIALALAVNPLAFAAWEEPAAFAREVAVFFAVNR